MGAGSIFRGGGGGSLGLGMIELALPRLHYKLKIDLHSLNLLNQGVFGIKIFLEDIPWATTVLGIHAPNTEPDITCIIFCYNYFTSTVQQYMVKRTLNCTLHSKLTFNWLRLRGWFILYMPTFIVGINIVLLRAYGKYVPERLKTFFC